MLFTALLCAGVLRVWKAYLDHKEEVRRDDVVQTLLADQSDYKETEIDKMIRTLHAKSLIVSQRGRYSRLWIK